MMPVWSARVWPTAVPAPHPALYPSIEPPRFELGGQAIEVTEAQLAANTPVALVRAGSVTTKT